MTTLKEKAQKLVAYFNIKRDKLLEPYYEAIPGKIDKLVLNTAICGLHSTNYYVYPSDDELELDKEESEKSIKIAEAYIIQEKLTYKLILFSDNSQYIKISW